MKSTETIIKLIAVGAIAVAVTGCGKLSPEPVQECPSVPVQVLNFEKTTVIELPAQPVDTAFKSIGSNDAPVKALPVVLTYTKDLKDHDTEIMGLASMCIADIQNREKRLQAIKQYLILNQ